MWLCVQNRTQQQENVHYIKNWAYPLPNFKSFIYSVLLFYVTVIETVCKKDVYPSCVLSGTDQNN